MSLPAQLYTLSGRKAAATSACRHGAGPSQRWAAPNLWDEDVHEEVPRICHPVQPCPHAAARIHHPVLAELHQCRAPEVHACPAAHAQHPVNTPIHIRAYANGLCEHRRNDSVLGHHKFPQRSRHCAMFPMIAHHTPAAPHCTTISVYGKHYTGSVQGHGDATQLL
jgi:hypothetical protein